MLRFSRAVILLLGAPSVCLCLALAGCGEPVGTAARTTPEGVALYDADHYAINLAPGPRFIIQMARPGAGSEWRLFSAPDNMGGVSLRGMQHADGSGRWTFDTIGAGSGTLNFQKLTPDSDEPSDSVTYEVNVE